MIALTTCFAVCAFVMLCIYCAWKTTCRNPLEFNMYIVEMYTMQKKRLVEVFYTDNETKFENFAAFRFCTLDQIMIETCHLAVS